ncbi:CAP domain-containing protein [Tundrisphaera lichenicola]|uniref:CAP domain-containing protein n=1 Tax=Tundrisphaera lichenicola TaxID=2029860 RepID=UPI003EBFF988
MKRYSRRPTIPKFMRIAASLGIVFAILGAQEPSTPKVDRAESDSIVAELVEAHNKERAKEDLPPLKSNPKLNEVALAHARDMAEREVMSHEGADGSTSAQRIARSGYHYLTAGENVAEGYRDVPAVIQGWMDSPPHRKNVMGDFSEIGLARVESKNGKPYWAAEFGKPMPKLDPAEAAKSLILGINKERADEMLGELVEDRRLAQAAQAVAVDLAENKEKPTTPSAFEKIDGKFYKQLAMTTSGGQPDAEVLLKSLMENPDYKAQIIGNYSRIGVGYAPDPDGIPRWTVILGLPSNR